MANHKSTKADSGRAHFESQFFQTHGASALEWIANEIRDGLIGQFERICKRSESPLEAAFAAWWATVTEAHLSCLELEHQVEVQTGQQCFRLDLVVVPSQFGTYRLLYNNPECPKFAIELDGHDFHEKTKEQVTRRNQRDRALQANGWIVAHVSGREFNADPYKVQQDVYLHAVGVFWKALRAAR